MKKQDILENQVNFAYLALGSNLGDKKNNLNKSIDLKPPVLEGVEVLS